jgi:hypothetical protein
MIATVEKGASTPVEGGSSGTVRSYRQPWPSDMRTRHVETKKAQASGLDLSQASIITFAGRGISAPTNWMSSAASPASAANSVPLAPSPTPAGSRTSTRSDERGLGEPQARHLRISGAINTSLA